MEHWDQLYAALDRRRTNLTEEALPALRENFGRLQSAFKNLYEVFLQKVLIKEDPYKYAQKISEVSIPSKDAILETDRTDEIGIRLSQYESQLEFLVNYYQFTVEFLSLKRIKLLASLAKYINWTALNEKSNQINTRAVAALFGKIKGGDDNFSSRLITDAQKQMAEAVRRILETLKTLSIFHRESYKMEIRSGVIEGLDPAILSNPQTDVAVDAVHSAFTSKGVALPFYQDLVKEILTEDFSPSAAAAREEVLSRLDVRQATQKKKEQASFKPILLDAVRLIAGSSRHIEIALEKLSTSAQTVDDSKEKRRGPIVRWLHRIAHSGKTARKYDVEFVDVTTSVSKVESVDFDAFVESTTRLARILATYANKMTPRYARLEESNEQSIYSTLEQSIAEIQKALKTMPALQDYFTSELSRPDREKLRNIKLDVNAIRNTVVRANQRRHEYISQKEEAEQLKRLGVT